MQQIPVNRAGLIGEGLLNVNGVVNVTAQILLESESVLTVNGHVGPSGSVSMTGELIGTSTPAIGQAFNPAIIVLRDGSFGKVELVGEAVSVDGGNLELNWSGGSGHLYGPQATTGSGPGSYNTEFSSLVASVDGIQNLTALSIPTQILSVFVNGLFQRPGSVSIIGTTITVPADMNIIAGDTIDIQYAF
jgi:hypothetical protein